MLLVAFWGLEASVHAQISEAPFPTTDRAEVHWTHHMGGAEVDLSRAMERFDALSHVRTELRSCGEKPFQRWAWWSEQRGGLAQAPKPSAWWHGSEVWRSAKQSMASSANQPSWSYIAPQTVPVHGGAGRINRVRIDPHDTNHWYACAPSGGLWHSFDEGSSWSVLGVDVLAPLGVTDVWVDPADASHLWLATGDGNGGDTYSIGILETFDAGASWEPIELAFDVSQGRKVYAMAAHPTTQGWSMVGTDLGLFKSTNGGVSFDLVLSGGTRDVSWLNDSTLVAAVENQGVFRSTDFGETWEAMELPASDFSVGRIQLATQAVPDNGTVDTLYAVAGHYFQQSFLAFWRSVDGGLTWTAEATRNTGPNLLGYTVSGADNGGQAFWDLCIAVDPNDANRVLVGGVNVWETTDGGETWSCPVHWQGALEAAYTHADQHSITFRSDGDVILSNDGGVFVWDDAGVRDMSHGLQITQGYAMGIHPQEAGRLLVGTQDNGTNALDPSVEARILDGDGFHAFFDAATPDRLYASAYYGLLYRSDDGGRTLTNIANYFQSSGPNEVGSWQTPFELHPAVEGRIVAAKKSLHHSDDGGETWESWGGMGTVRSTALALTALDAEAALVAKNATLYHRDASSQAFEEVNGLPGLTIGDVAFASNDADEWWVSFAGYDSDQQVWRTTDAGANWENLSTGLPALPIHVLTPLPNGSWACGSELGVHVWDESAQSWSDLGQGLPLTPVVDMAVDSLLNRMVVSTYGRGLWACALPSAPEVSAAVVDIMAPPTQCLNQLTGQPVVHASGTGLMDAVGYVVAAERNGEEVRDTVWTDLEQPLAHGDRTSLSAFQLDVPTAGDWEVSITCWMPEAGDIGPTHRATFWASGLGHQTTLTWWGDCENADMRWALTDQTTNDLIVQSVPLAPGDTVMQTWCLSEGCYALTWSDKGGDGFSGDDCGEEGGYQLAGPFGDIWAQSEGDDFGEETTATFCISVPWCYADYNGDGLRSVDDLLTLLSEFGCQTSCFTDTNFDASVGVADLMNMLTVYGQDCDP